MVDIKNSVSDILYIFLKAGKSLEKRAKIAIAFPNFSYYNDF